MRNNIGLKILKIMRDRGIKQRHIAEASRVLALDGRKRKLVFELVEILEG